MSYRGGYASSPDRREFFTVQLPRQGWDDSTANNKRRVSVYTAKKVTLFLICYTQSKDQIGFIAHYGRRLRERKGSKTHPTPGDEGDPRFKIETIWTHKPEGYAEGLSCPPKDFANPRLSGAVPCVPFSPFAPREPVDR